ncbi:MAG: hypothetical protein GX580_17565 [Candidatus Hydrogenedens sp.]|nr:hypothetical protein [Candidatus Hydrogenedentota bacterium]NLF59438.1 hypothetical protein [Candidatus Hydrogenedens sp.]
MSIYKRRTLALPAALLMGVLAAVPWGCAPAREKTAESGAKPARTAAAPAFPKASFQHETAPAGDIVRKIGEEVGGGIVLMQGLEERSMPGFEVDGAAYAALVQKLAEPLESRAEPLPHAWFIAPPDYAGLLDTRLEGRLPERFAAMTGTVAFGAKTPLSNVLAVLSQNMGVTLVADNFITGARCGELFMGPAPLPEILAAVLMSARVPPDAYAVEGTDEYVFIRSTRNTAPPSLLVNGENLTPEQRALLDRVVDVVLPEPGANPVETAFGARPAPLKSVLTPLTQQFRVVVSAKKVLADVPVTPCVMRGVRLGTAMDLMLRQWPTDRVVWEVVDDQVLIRPR